ncbi:septal ring lytic transglycosylase RlpA family protein, partial [Moraxella catarrhalis]
QNQQILDYLMAGNTITPLEALERFGCFSLAARVYELKNTHGKIILLLILVASHAQAHTATWYGGQFHGKLTASGERYNQNAFTCASNKYKFGTRLKVINKANGKSVICRVNDRGGFGKYGTTLDLSKGAFKKIAPLSDGKVRVMIRRV